jgi:dipeptidyl aminopeptidase/acylaminoacyl peptidase
MIRRAGATRGTRDPYGLGPVAGYIGPIVAGVTLLIVAAMTWSFMNGQVPFRGSSAGTNAQPGTRTPAPTNVVIVEPAVTFPGTIVYAKAGNIWTQKGTAVKQITDSGQDSMPSFSPDGKWIYFIRESPGRGLFPVGNRLNWYDLATPDMVRIPTDGSGPAERVVGGQFKSGRSTWFFWMRQPVLSPDGTTIALITDGPNPTNSDVVVQTYDTNTKKFTKLKVAQQAPLGHQDPAWRPDGKILLFVKNGRDGTRGTPQLVRYDPATTKSVVLTGPGYLAPSWSPDGRFVAATRTDSFGTDIVILDAGTGAEILRVTDDEHAFAPAWSPAGDAIAFLHLEGSIVDLKMAPLKGAAGSWAVGKTVDLTSVSGLDAGSRPGWFVPASELAAPSPSPSGSAGPAGSAASPSVSGSGAP